MQEARALGIRIDPGRAIAKVSGGKRVRKIQICAQDGIGGALEELDCDAVAMSGGWSPVVHLWSHCGGKLTWDEGQAHFRPDATRPPTGADGQGFVIATGSANGFGDLAAVLNDAVTAGKAAAKAAGFKPKRSAALKTETSDEDRKSVV